MNDKPIPDAVGLAISVAGLVFSSNIAHLIGPYMVIVIAAVIGAGAALSRREKSNRPGAVLFMARIVGLAVLLTVPAAQFVNLHRPALPVAALLAPVALLVGLIGDDWPTVATFLLQKVVAGFDLLRSAGKKS